MKINILNHKKIKPYWRNPRQNDESQPHLIESIKKFGFRVPIILDKDNVIVTGHARYKASTSLIGNLGEHIKALIKKKKPIALIKNLQELDKGNIPVTYALGLNPKEIKEYRISDNKVAEHSFWDEKALEAELKTIGNAIGFSPEELEDLIGQANMVMKEINQDDIDKKAGELDAHFKDMYDQRDKYLDLTCPKCAHDFKIAKTEITGTPKRYLLSKV